MLIDILFLAGGIVLGVLFPTVFKPLVTSAISKFENASATYDTLKATLEKQAADLTAQSAAIKDTIAKAEAPAVVPSPQVAQGT